MNLISPDGNLNLWFWDDFIGFDFIFIEAILLVLKDEKTPMMDLTISRRILRTIRVMRSQLNQSSIPLLE